MFGYSVRDYQSLSELVKSINSGVLAAKPETAAAKYAVEATLSYTVIRPRSI